jgi:cell division topological specificity factor
MMLDLFKLFSKESSSSKNVAKERLKLVLVNDRINCTPHFLEMIKEDLLDVISDYVEIEESGLDIKITKTKRDIDDTMVSALVANVPIKRMKTR